MVPQFDAAVVKGHLYGGGLSVPVIRDSRWKVKPVRTIPWAVCTTGRERPIAASWVSEVSLAGIQPRSLTGSLKDQADAIAADSVGRFYLGTRARMAMTSNTAVTVEKR